jgi:hypothetical protein
MVRYAQRQHEKGSFINMTTVVPLAGRVGGTHCTPFQDQTRYPEPPPAAKSLVMARPPHNSGW